VIGTGEGGLAELVSHLSEDRVSFCLLRVIAADVQANVTSNREKFTYITWIGSKVGVMVRAKVGMQTKDVQTYFRGVSLVINVDAGVVADLEMETLAKKLLACGGAHKPTKYVFGPGQEYSLLDILGAAGPRTAFVSSADRTPTSPTSPSTASTEERKGMHQQPQQRQRPPPSKHQWSSCRASIIVTTRFYLVLPLSMVFRVIFSPPPGTHYPHLTSQAHCCRMARVWMVFFAGVYV